MLARAAYNMADITIRQATPGDEEEQFSSIYDGIDYLPEYIAEFMAFTNTTSYVAIKNNKIIGYTSMFIVDDGETVIVRASRVCPDHSRQGVYKHLHAFTLEQTSARVVAFTTNNLNEHINKTSFLQEHKLLESKSITVYLIDKDVCFKAKDMSGLRVPTDAELYMYFKSGVIKPYLFTEDRIIVDWVPFQLLKSNISLMKSHRTKFCSNVFVCNDGTVNGLLSVSTTIRVQYPPYICHLYIYGRDKCSNTLYQHIIAHAMGAQEMTLDGSVVKLFVYTEHGCFQEMLDNVAMNIGLAKSEWKNKHNQMYTHALLFEKMLK